MVQLKGRDHFVGGCEVYVHRYRELMSRTRRHSHDFLEIAFVTRGTGTHHHGCASYRVGPGDIFVINREEPHYFSDLQDLEILYLLVGPHALAESARRVGRLPGFVEVFPLGGRIASRGRQCLHLEHAFALEVETLLARMQTELRQHAAGYSLVMESLLMEFFVAISRFHQGRSLNFQAPEQPAPTRHTMRKVLAYMEAHFDKDISLLELAQFESLNPQYFCRLFKRATGLTAMQYLNHRRIQKACQLLMATSEPVTTICAKVGFNDLSHFIRTFHQRTGTSPRRFREKSRNANFA